MSDLYTPARTAFLRGQINMVTDTILVTLVDETFEFIAGQTYLDAIGGRIGGPVVASVTDVTNGQALVAPMTFPSVPDGVTVMGLVVYKGGTTAIDSPLIGFVDRRSDSIAIGPLAGTGSDLIFTFDYLIKI